MNDGVFYAEIEISNLQMGQIMIDSRPSDAVALALRTSSEIYVSDEVMDRASNDEDISNDNKEIHQRVSSEELMKEHTEEMLLENLNEALEKAILEEEYEIAARLRDRIKQLEKKSTS